VASPSQDPDAVAGTPMGGEHGGNTDQPEAQSEAPETAEASADKPAPAGPARAKRATGGAAK
jgi:hypothetical protein